MVYFIVTWSLLAIVCSITGMHLLNLLKIVCFDRWGDRILAAAWTGMSLLAVLLLTVSFVLPLSSITGVILAIALISVSFLSASTRSDLLCLKSVFSASWLIALLCFSLLAAAIFNRPIEWFDTGGYHIGAIKWLAEAGTVPGIALINTAFGFTSSWFALSAPFIPKFLGHHIGAVTNGFVFLLTVVHIAVAASHIRNRHGKLSDWFAIVIFSAVVAVYLAALVAGSPILVSFSPDVPVTLLSGAIAWTILVLKEAALAANPDAGIAGRSVQPSQAAANEPLLLLILGAGAVSLKLSALPVLAIVMLLYGWETRLKLGRLLIGAVLVTVMLLPMLGYGMLTSGCPLLPSTVACVNLPWRIPQEEAATQLESTQVLRPGAEDTPQPELQPAEADRSAFWQKRFAWLQTQPKVQIMLLFYLVSAALTIRQLGFSQHRKLLRAAAWIDGIAVLGMTFIIFYAPIIRFGLIYFVLIPGLFLAQILSWKRNPRGQAMPQPFFSRLSLTGRRALAVGLTCCCLVLLAGQRPVFSLLPPDLPQPALVQTRINDVEYVYPANWTYKCWASPLPCSGIVLENVRLRNAAQGTASGFVRAF